MNVVKWELNPQATFTADLTDDEISLLTADIQDAIDGVIEDWSGR
jgi:hypothetical protein